MMRNDDGKKLNSIVYTMVLKNILDEYSSNKCDVELKQKAIDTYKKMEEKKLLKIKNIICINIKTHFYSLINSTIIIGESFVYRKKYT